MRFHRSLSILFCLSTFSLLFPTATNAYLTPEAEAIHNSWTDEAVKAAVPRNRTLPEELQARFRHLRGISEEEEQRRLQTVAEAFWPSNKGQVSIAAGRIRFKMGGSYVCSGTAVTDETTGRSVIITAAHCVYDEVGNRFATDVQFIPAQHDTTGSRTDSNCNNDRFGCWAVNFGVIDKRWADGSWPAIIRYDYAFYVVADEGRHTGTGRVDALDEAVLPMDVTFEEPTCQPAQLIGYSYNEDPLLEYCSQSWSYDNYYGSYYFNPCLLSGGASGGPSMCTNANGDGPLNSVVSWGGGSAMGGPYLFDNSAECLYQVAKTSPFENGNVIVDFSQPCPIYKTPTATPTPAPTDGTTNQDALYSMVGYDTKCPYKSSQRLFRTPDNAPLTVDECYQECYDTPGCEFFSLGVDPDHAKHIGVCIGCVAGSNLVGYTGFDSFEMVVKPPPPTNDDYDFVAFDTKCPLNDRLFRTHDNSPLSVQECYQLCLETEGCQYFSIGEGDNLSTDAWIGVCMGCVGTATFAGHNGFNVYEVAP